MSQENKLTVKQEVFVQEYATSGNGTRAAIKAGYSENAAKEIAYENLTKPHIWDAIVKTKQERLNEIGVDAILMLAEVKKQYEQADAEGKTQYALRALEILGKHIEVQAFEQRIDLTTNGKEITNPLQDMSTEEIRAFLRLLSDKPMDGV